VAVYRLYLRNNYLTSLTEFTFRDLSGLRYLFLTNNRIYRIERRSLRILRHLLCLVLRGNPLAEIDRMHFHTPSTLSYIDMSECGLTTVPRGLPESLRYIQLRRNNLTILDAESFSECPQVNILVLDENRIQTVHNGTFTTMSHLQRVRRTQKLCFSFVLAFIIGQFLSKNYYIHILNYVVHLLCIVKQENMRFIVKLHNQKIL